MFLILECEQAQWIELTKPPSKPDKFIFSIFRKGVGKQGKMVLEVNFTYFILELTLAVGLLFCKR